MNASASVVRTRSEPGTAGPVDLDAGRGCRRRRFPSHQDTWLRRTVASMRPWGSVVEM